MDISNFHFSKNNFLNTNLEKKEWRVKILILLLLIIFFGLLGFNKIYSKREFKRKEALTHSKKKKIIFLTDQEIYTELYSKLYDFIHFDKYKIIKELEIIPECNNKSIQPFILDVGSGNGHHVYLLNEKNIKTIGIDQSHDMVNSSNKMYPQCEFKVGNCETSLLFNPNSFSHILCLGSTIYEIKNKKQFLENAHNWLKPGGFLIISISDENQIKKLPYGKGPITQPIKSLKKGIKLSQIQINDYLYKAKTKRGTLGSCWISEHITNTKTGEMIKNNRTWPCMGITDIKKYITDSGFKYETSNSLKKVGYPYEYIFIFSR